MSCKEMRKPDLLELGRERFVVELDRWCEKNGVSRCELDDRVVATRPLISEAVWSPERDDFPLLWGKEVLMEASYRAGAARLLGLERWCRCSE